MQGRPAPMKGPGGAECRVRALPLHRLPNITEQTEVFSQLTSEKGVKGTSEPNTQRPANISNNAPHYNQNQLDHSSWSAIQCVWTPDPIHVMDRVWRFAGSQGKHINPHIVPLFKGLWWNLIKRFAFCVLTVLLFAVTERLEFPI